MILYCSQSNRPLIFATLEVSESIVFIDGDYRYNREDDQH